MRANLIARVRALLPFWAVAYFALALIGSAQAESVLRVVKPSDLKIFDPIWNGGYITRDHGYMIYDTLFAFDAHQQPQPQMVRSWQVSADKLTYTFTLREGLKWHDGTPVTSEDCVVSIKRWGARDTMGQRLLASIQSIKAVDSRTFELVLTEPYALVLASLAKPSSNVPFMMPQRVAETSPNEPITDYTGSGPFQFKKDEWRPGEKVIYVKNTDYKPRIEEPSWLSGAKKANVDRVEWLHIPDTSTAINALLAGEVDMVEDVPVDLLPILEADRRIQLKLVNTLGNQYVFRFNSIQPPFDKPKNRQAVFATFNQEDFLRTTIGNSQYYDVCHTVFICDTPLATDRGTGPYFHSDFALARNLLSEGGYDGSPVVLLHSTDLSVLANLAPVAKSLLERGGFKVNMLDMDWQSVLGRINKKERPLEGGWSAFMTSFAAVDVMNPVVTRALAANCQAASMPGWPCDREMEELRNSYAREDDATKQKEIAAKVQQRAIEIGTHVWLGQWHKPIAFRKDRVDGWLEAPFLVFWNVVKKN